MISFTLTGKLVNQEAPVLITNLREAVVFFWNAITGERTPLCERKVDMTFGLVLALALLHEGGVGMGLLPLLRMAGFERATITLNGVVGEPHVELPMMVMFESIQGISTRTVIPCH